MLTIRIERRLVTRVVVAGGILGAIAVLAQVPNTFTSNTVIRSADVNANFTALDNGKQTVVSGTCPAGQAIGSIQTDGGVTCHAAGAGGAGAFSSTSFTFSNVCATSALCISNLASISFTPPATGTVLAMAMGFCNLPSATLVALDVSFSTDAANMSAGGVAYYWVYRTDSSAATGVPLNVSEAFPVTNTSTTLYLNALNVSNTPDVDCSANITVLFLPTGM